MQKDIEKKANMIEGISLFFPVRGFSLGPQNSVTGVISVNIKQAEDRVFCATKDGTVFIFNGNTMEEISRVQVGLKGAAGMRRRITSMIRIGLMIWVATENGVITVFDVITTETIFESTCAAGSFIRKLIVVHRDDEIEVWGSHAVETSVMRWNSTTFESLQPLQLPEGASSIGTMAIVQNTDLILIACRNIVYIYQDSGKLLHTWKTGIKGSINTILSEENLTVWIGAASGEISKWVLGGFSTINAEKVAAIVCEDKNVRSLLRTENVLISGSNAGMAIWDAEKLNCEQPANFKHCDTVYGLCLANGRIWSGALDGNLNIWIRTSYIVSTV